MNGGRIARSPLSLTTVTAGSQPNARLCEAEHRPAWRLLNTGDGARPSSLRPPSRGPEASRARAAALRLRPTSATASAAARAAASRGLRPRGDGDGEPAPTVATTAAPAADSGRPADVSPLAAVIGIALLGGMLLIGVLIGRGGTDDEPAPAPTIQVGDAATAGRAGVERREQRRGGGDQRVAAGHRRIHDPAQHGAKDGATAENVDAAKQTAVTEGAIDAAVLDSDLYASLPPGNYVIYSGVYTDRKSAEVAPQGPGKELPVGRGGRGLERRSAAARAARIRRMSARSLPAQAARVRSRRRRAHRRPRSEPEPDRAAEAVLQDPAPDAAGGRERPGDLPDRGPGAVAGRGATSGCRRATPGRPAGRRATPGGPAAGRGRTGGPAAGGRGARAAARAAREALRGAPVRPRGASSTRWRSVTTSASTSSSAERPSCRPSMPS